AGKYFSPHLAQQPFFQQSCVIEPTPVADRIGAHMLSLPITDAMTVADVQTVCEALRGAIAGSRVQVPAREPQRVRTVLIGGGPAGVALLISASKKQQLRDFAAG